MFSFDEPSALLSNARSTIATLIQRPSSITTSNAFDEFSILDHLIDVSNDVDRFEDGENRKFVNIAQVITASTCIYSRRVDALYKLINTFQSSSTSPGKSDESESSPILERSNEKVKKEEDVPLKKKKLQHQQQQSFICQDTNKINLNPTKTFFLDRTAHFDFQLFRNYVPIGNKQFWINDHRPMIFELLFNDQILDNHQPNSPIERIINDIDPSSPEKVQAIIPDDDLPLPFPILDAPEPPSWHDETIIEQNPIIEKKKLTRSNRRKKTNDNDVDLNLFRHGLTDQQQALFHSQKFKSSTNKKNTTEPKTFFQKTFHRKHFEQLITNSINSKTFETIFIYPFIINHYLSIRERYSIKIDRIPTIHSSPQTTTAFEDNLIFSYSPTYLPSDDVQEDMDIRLQTDMEQMLDAALTNSQEEHEQNEIFLQLRSSISDYMFERQSVVETNVDDLVEILLPNQYSLPLIFSQLLHLCASTQRYYLHSTDNDDLILEKII